METMEKMNITVQATVNSPIEKVWEVWNNPNHITQWCAASDDWHAPFAENDLRKDGRFKTTMAAKDGSMRFDFSGVYTQVDQLKSIEYVLDDGRKVKIVFSPEGSMTKVTETFEAENTHPVDMQRGGWQAILNNFKAHAERL